MSILDQFTPTQRTALLVGVPVVGLAVIVSTRRAPAPEPVEEASPPTGTIPGYMPDTAAIGTGELAGWGELWAKALTSQSERITELETRPSSTPAKPPKFTVGLTYVRTGETANAIAIRLRAGGAKTADNRALTGAYLVAFNNLRNAKGRPTSTTARLWTGQNIRY